MATFLDFMLMKELVESLESQTRDNEGRRAEETKSDPENFFLVVDPKAWKRAQEVCKREKLVVAMEITNQFDDTCHRVRSLFTGLAKEFDSIPFFRVVTGPGRQLTMEQVRAYLLTCIQKPCGIEVSCFRSLFCRCRFQSVHALKLQCLRTRLQLS